MRPKVKKEYIKSKHAPKSEEEERKKVKKNIWGSTAYSEDKQALMQEQTFSEFRRLATTKNIHITMVIHPRKVSALSLHISENCEITFWAKDKDERDLTPNSLYGGLKASQEADNVMIIQTRFHRLPEPYHEKYLQVKLLNTYQYLEEA